MSRAALRVQEGNAREREQRAEEIFARACDEGRNRPNALPLWADDRKAFHFNPLLLRHTIQSPYFQKCCEKLKDWNAVIDEIYYEVKHLLVYQLADQPSTAFCLLLRLLCLRMTAHQLDLTLKHEDSPYIRAIGFLYLRYAGPPESLSELIGPYLYDEETLNIEKASSKNSAITMGEFVRNLFQSREYGWKGMTTPLPRLPLPIERDLHVQLLAADRIAQRAVLHLKNARRMQALTTIGAHIRALYGDDENPVTWYEAQVDRVIPPTRPGGQPKFVVTFPEYGNTETVTLGEVDVLDSSSSLEETGTTSMKSRNRSYAGHHEPNDKRDLYREVQLRERDRVAASDKGSWSRRPPPTTKESLSSHNQGGRGYGETGRHDRHHNDERHYGRTDDSYQHHPKLPPHPTAAAALSRHGVESQPSTAAAAPPPPKKRTNEEMAKIAEKKRKLMAKYG